MMGPPPLTSKVPTPMRPAFVGRCPEAGGAGGPRLGVALIPLHGEGPPDAVLRSTHEAPVPGRQFASSGRKGLSMICRRNASNSAHVPTRTAWTVWSRRSGRRVSADDRQHQAVLGPDPTLGTGGIPTSRVGCRPSPVGLGRTCRSCRRSRSPTVRQAWVGAHREDETETRLPLEVELLSPGRPAPGPSGGPPATSGSSPAGTASDAIVRGVESKSAPRAASTGRPRRPPARRRIRTYSFPSIRTQVRSPSGTTRPVRPPRSTSRPPMSWSGPVLYAEPSLDPSNRTGPSRVSARPGRRTGWRDRGCVLPPGSAYSDVGEQQSLGDRVEDDGASSGSASTRRSPPPAPPCPRTRPRPQPRRLPAAPSAACSPRSWAQRARARSRTSLSRS